MGVSKASFGAVILAMVSIGTTVAVAADPEDQIKYRQNTMAANGGHAGAISLLLRGKVEHPSHLAPHARALNGLAATLTDLFPEGSDFGETRAKAEIWSKPDEFATAIATTQDAVAAFTAAVEAEDQEAIGPAFEEVGKSCKGCHEEFRQKEE
jgi:cytochrome c556